MITKPDSVFFGSIVDGQSVSWWCVLHRRTRTRATTTNGPVYRFISLCAVIMLPPLLLVSAGTARQRPTRNNRNRVL